MEDIMGYVLAVVVIGLGSILACVGADALSSARTVESLVGGTMLLASGGGSLLLGAMRL